MKILVAASGSRGDVQPMLMLANALQARGHQVTVCGPENFQKWAQELGLQFEIGATDLQVFFGENRDATSSALRFMRKAVDLLRAEVDRQFDAVERLAPGQDVMVCGGAFLAGASVAQHLRLPYVGVAYVPLVVPSHAHPPPVLPIVQPPRVVNRGLWMAFEAFMRLSIGSRYNERRAALGMPPLSRFLSHIVGTRPVVAADPEVCPIPDELKRSVVQTGALSWVTNDTLPDDVEAFLNAGPPPVYIGFGSMADANPAETTRLIVRAVQKVGVRAIISRGWAGIGEQLPSSCLAVGPVSHHALFRRVAAVVHHGGAGTTASGSRSGVPQVVVPHIADQFYFASRVHRLGVAPAPIPRPRLTAERLARALRKCVQDEGMKAKARVLGETLRRRHGVEETILHIESLFPSQHPSTTAA